MVDPEDGDAVEEPRIVKSVRRRAVGREWRHLAEEPLEDVSPTIPLVRKFWALVDDEREQLAELICRPPVHTLITSLQHGDESARISLLDAAYWMKGWSSLGALRFATLVKIEEAGRRDRMALLDLQEAVGSPAPTARIAEMPADHAERIVAGATALSPNLGERMAPARAFGKPLVVRELMPPDLKLEIALEAESNSFAQ